MKLLMIAAVAGVFSLAAPAFAQDPGQPGAVGTGHGLTGSNTGTGGATSMSGHSRHATGMMMHHRRHHYHRSY